MTFFKIIYYHIWTLFHFKEAYRGVSIEIGEDNKKPEILLWGIATQKGWEQIKNDNLNK